MDMENTKNSIDFRYVGNDCSCGLILEVCVCVFTNGRRIIVAAAVYHDSGSQLSQMGDPILSTLAVVN